MAADVYPGQVPIQSAIDAGLVCLWNMWQVHTGMQGVIGRTPRVFTGCGNAPATYDSAAAFVAVAKTSFGSFNDLFFKDYGYSTALFTRMRPIVEAAAATAMLAKLVDVYSHANMKDALVGACQSFIQPVLEQAMGLQCGSGGYQPDPIALHASIDPYIVDPSP